MKKPAWYGFDLARADEWKKNGIYPPAPIVLLEHCYICGQPLKPRQFCAGCLCYRVSAESEARPTRPISPTDGRYYPGVQK